MTSPGDLARFSSKQRALIEAISFSDNAIVAAQGAVRSGKTHGAIFGFLTWSQAEFDDHWFIIAGQSLASVRRNVLRPLISLLVRLRVPYVWQEQKSELTVGKLTYLFVGANTERAQDRIQGLTAAGAFLDEAVLLPRSFIMQVIARLTFANSKLLCTYNPDSPWHWFKKEVVDALHPQVIKFGLNDNPVLAEETKARYRRMFSGVFYERFVLGEWAAAEGAIYPHFKVVASAGDERPIFVDWAIDYGLASVHAGLKIAGYADGRCVVTDEYYRDARTAGQISDDLFLTELVHRFETPVDRVWCDPAAASIKLHLRAGKLPVRDANNDVLEGIKATSVRLTNGALTVSEKCTNLIAELRGYRWDSKKQDDGIDAPVKSNDHACDALRYFVMARMALYSGKISQKPKGF